MRRRDGAGAEAAVCAGFCALFQKTGGGFGAGAREERFSGRRAGRVARISPRADGPEGHGRRREPEKKMLLHVQAQLRFARRGGVIQI